MMSQIMSTNWQSRKTVAECNRYMLENEIRFDITFLVGENRRRISAHQYVLISRSSVFQAMLCGPLAGKEAEVIEIPDTPEEAFKLLLRYMYYGEVEVSPEFALSTLYAAKKYDVGGLEDILISWLDENITVETVCVILDQAIMYDEKNLEEKCLLFIDNHASVIIPSDEFKGMTKDSLVKVVGRDSLVADEDKIFEAVMEWSKAECSRRDLFFDGKSQREILGEAINLIRFPLLDKEFFTQTVSKFGILSLEESAQICEVIDGESDTCLGYSSEPRIPLKMKVLRYASPAAEMNWGQLFKGVRHGFRFSCDKTINLIGVGVYPPLFSNGPCDVTVEILEDNEHIGGGSITLEPSMSSDPRPVLFEEEIHVSAKEEIDVVIQVQCSNPCVFHNGRDGMDTVHNNGYTFTFSESEMACYVSNWKTGQIPEIIFTASPSP